MNEDRGTRDAFIIRVAEMYLIVAEAGAKAGKADAVDLYEYSSFPKS